MISSHCNESIGGGEDEIGFDESGFDEKQVPIA
jgi:hypothetical protein